MEQQQQQQVVVDIPYALLADPGANLNGAIHQAYSADGLGVLTVSGVPGFPELRSRLLTLASSFAALPEERRNAYVDELSGFNFGWSHGQESMQNGQPDTHKGSYYANPLDDAPAKGDAALMHQHPQYFRPNVWPTPEDVPGFEQAFKDLGRLIVEVGMLLAVHCDKYTASQAATAAVPFHKVAQVLQRSRNHKARLLHYFPQQQQQQDQQQQDQQQGSCEDSWCGWHTDHGSITGLTPALYVAGDGREVPNPDPASGLYIRSRQGDIIKAALPATSMAFQVGEALQVHSGGALQATPHCVRAARGPAAVGVARNAFAVFMQPDVTEAMDAPAGVSAERVRVGQWRPGQTFGEFSAATFNQYYS